MRKLFVGAPQIFHFEMPQPVHLKLMAKAVADGR
jgi:hypothetical protein